jgi:hypothetical protein
MQKSQRQLKREYESAIESLRFMIIDFMHFVKTQKPDDPDAEEKVNAKFKEINAKWKSKCHSKDCAWMGLKDSMFADEIQGEAKKHQGVISGAKAAIKKVGKIISLSEYRNGL